MHHIYRIIHSCMIRSCLLQLYTRVQTTLVVTEGPALPLVPRLTPANVCLDSLEIAAKKVSRPVNEIPTLAGYLIKSFRKHDLL